MSGRLLPRQALAAAGVALAAAAISTQTGDYGVYVLSMIAWLALMALGFDVLLGFAGYLSLAHAALFGVGAYAYANLAARLEWNGWLALLGAGLLTAATGALAGLVAFRTRGLYFAVLTLGLGLLGFQLFVFAQGLTGGLTGFAGIPALPQPAWIPLSPGRFALFGLLGALWLGWIAAAAFVRSPVGRDCVAVREDETLALALGIRVGPARLAAFAFSALLAGIAGAFYAAISAFVGPESFTVLGAGFQLVVIVVVGGMGTLWGPVLGAALLTLLTEGLRETGAFSLLIYGALLLAFIRFAPRGLAGMVAAALRRRAAARGAADRARGADA